MGAITDKQKQFINQYVPLIILLIFTWVKAAAMLARVTDPDPGLFESFAYHMHEGKVLYGDIWDHKPPLVFWLNLVFLKVFGFSEDGISYGSLVFSLIQTVVFYALSLRLMKHVLPAFLGTAIFITVYFSVFIFGSGNYTEQYAVLCTSSGLLFFIRHLDTSKQMHLWVSGILFGIAIWFKEPFVFSAAPYFIYLLWKSIKNKSAFASLFYFTLAFLIPALLVANLIVLTGGKEGYIEHLVHSRIYAKSLNTTPLLIKLGDNRFGFFSAIPLNVYIAMAIYLAAVIWLILKSNAGIIILLILGQQIFDYLGTGMSGNRFFHYYLQTTPLTILLILTALSVVGDRLAEFNKHIQAIPIFLAMLFFAFKFEPLKAMRWSPAKDFDDKISEYMKQNVYYKPRPVALASKDIGFYLLRVQGISEVRYIVPYPYHWIKIPGQPKHQQMKDDSARFAEWNPEYIIRSDHYSELFEDCGLDSIIELNYSIVATTQLLPDKNAYLLKRKHQE